MRRVARRPGRGRGRGGDGDAIDGGAPSTGARRSGGVHAGAPLCDADAHVVRIKQMALGGGEALGQRKAIRGEGGTR